jgi:hypothetical protein
MDRDQARTMLEAVDAEYVETQDEIRKQRSRLDGIIEVRRGLLRMFPDLREETAPDPGADVEMDRPKGAEAVKWILEHTAGKWFSVPMVHRELEVREWVPGGSDKPMNATRAALDRLVTSDPQHFKKDRGEKSGKAVYAYKPSATQPINEVSEVPALAYDPMASILSGGPHPEDAPGQ